MVNSKLRRNLISIYLVFIMVFTGFSGIQIFEGIVDTGGVAADNIYVSISGGGDYTMIKTAISNAKDGDTIYVWAGTYKENVFINKKITLIGNGTTNTTIDGKLTGDVVRISSDGANITGFKIIRSGTKSSGYNFDAGIELSMVRNVSVYNNNCSNNRIGINVYFSDSNNIFNNTCNSNDMHGIYAIYSDSNIFTNNTCLDQNNGIDLRYSDSNTIINNTCSNNRDGIYLSMSDQNRVNNNNCSSNIADGIKITNSNSPTITYNNCPDNAYGIYLASSNSASINNNTMSSCGFQITGIQRSEWDSHTIDNTNTINGKPVCYRKNQNGGTIPSSQAQIILAGCSKIVIENRNCSAASTGIQVGFSDNITIRKNTCNSNKFRGIYLQNSIYCDLINNTCKFNKEDGMYLDRSNWNKIMNNTCNSNLYSGITLVWSRSKYINNNTCNSNRWNGISLGMTDSSIINNNTCKSNDGVGIQISNSDSNQIYDNNFNLNGNFGLSMRQSQSNNLRDNNCNYNNWSGIFITQGSHQTTVTNCIGYSNTEYGIYVRSSNLIEIKDCHWDLNSLAGMFFFLSEWNNVDNNSIKSNIENGIHLNQADWNTFVRNNISSNQIGIFFESLSDNNTFVENHISSNSNEGFQIDANSNDNIIYHNNLISNTQQATDYSDNIWSYNNDGNYWSDYTGVDDGTDGRVAGDWIGDTKLPHLELDHYPFITPSGWLLPGTPTLLDPGESDADGNYTITWTVSNNALGFMLQEATDSSFDSPKELYNGTNLTFILIDKNEGTYYYRLRAYNDHDYSLWSDIIDITVDFPPRSPKNLKISRYPLGNALNLTWDLNLEDTIIYELYYKSSMSAQWSHLDNISHPTHTYNHTGLGDGDMYYYRVRAKDHRGQLSEFSENAHGTSMDSVAPRVPTGLEVTKVTFNSVALSWDPNTEYDFKGYNIYKSEKPDTFTNDDLIGKVLRGYEKYTDAEGLTELSTYYYAITAYDEVPNESEFSGSITATTSLGPHRPEINNSLADIVILEDTYDDTSIKLYQWFKDVNSDKLSFDCDGQEHIKVTIFQVNGTVILVPETNWNGQETLTFSASDAKDKVSDEITITVIPVNDPPELLEIVNPKNGSKFNDGTLINFTATATDPDLPYGDELTFKWLDTGYNVLGNTQNVSEILLPIGVHLITFEVSDKKGSKSNTSIYISILETPESDSDGDGMPNVWERIYDLDPKDPTDGDYDTDEDGLTNIEEYHINTEPNDQDTDGDGHNDGVDIYPLDKARWQEEGKDDGEGGDQEDSTWVFALVGVVILAIILLLLFIFLIKNKSGQTAKGGEISTASGTVKPPMVGTPGAQVKPTTQPESEQQDVCMTCGHQMFFDKEKNQNYCYRCKKYE